jgi:hypothetical protein
MRSLRRAAAVIVGAVALTVSVVAVVVASAPDESEAAYATGPITLVFAGQVVEGAGIGPFVDAYPPIEGGAARRYTVPAGRRLVIDSMYADVFERWVPPSDTQPGTGPRSGVTVGISTAYDLGSGCAYPGYERDYGIPLIDPVVAGYGAENEALRNGSTLGPIFVEGGRLVTGTAFAPNGDSTLYVKIVVHGHLEYAVNPRPPTCG